MTISVYHFDWEGDSWVRIMAQNKDSGKVVGYVVCEKERAESARDALETILKPEEKRHVG